MDAGNFHPWMRGNGSEFECVSLIGSDFKHVSLIGSEFKRVSLLIIGSEFEHDLEENAVNPAITHPRKTLFFFP